MHRQSIFFLHEDRGCIRVTLKLDIACEWAKRAYIFLKQNNETRGEKSINDKI